MSVKRWKYENKSCTVCIPCDDLKSTNIDMKQNQDHIILVDCRLSTDVDDSTIQLCKMENNNVFIIVIISNSINTWVYLIEWLLCVFIITFFFTVRSFIPFNFILYTSSVRVCRQSRVESRELRVGNSFFHLVVLSLVVTFRFCFQQNAVEFFLI